jgi:hypothetical protein
MLNYESQVKPLEDEGKTDAQIAAFYAHKTAKPVPCSSVKVLLEENGLVIEDPVTRVRSGALITYYAGLADGTAKTLLGWFISHVFGRGETIASDTQPRATQVVETIASLPGPMAAIGVKIIELGGGQPYDGLDAAGVAAVRAAYDASIAEVTRQNTIQALRAEIENTWVNPAVADGVSTAEQVRAAIKAGL